MGIKSHLYKAIFLLLLLAACPAWAQDTVKPLHFNGRYDFDWNGIPLGRIALSIDQEPGHYKVRLQVASAGIVNLFTRHASDTVAEGRITATGYHPVFYESYYKTKKKPRHIKLEFDEKGAVTTEINEPPEDRNDRPEVPHSLKDGSFDPLTGMMAVLAGTREPRVFDAKRLYSVKAAECRPDRIYIAGKWRESLSCTLSRSPLSGLTRRETKEYQEGEPPLRFYYSDRDTHVPLGIRMPAPLGYVRGTLVRECPQWQECDLHADAR